MNCPRAAVVIVLIVGVTAAAAVSEDGYGPFQLRMQGFKACKGVKKRDCVRAEYSLQGERMLEVFLNVLEDVRVDAMRLTMVNAGKANSNPLVNLHLKRPCADLYIGQFFRMMLSQDRSCSVKKGVFNFTADIALLTEKFWGGKFFYGNFTTKSVIYSDKCNFACTILNMNFSPTTH